MYHSSRGVAVISRSAAAVGAGDASTPQPGAYGSAPVTGGKDDVAGAMLEPSAVNKQWVGAAMLAHSRQ